MSRVVLVSKSAASGNGSPGGRRLATALRSTFRRTRGVWFGWDDVAREHDPQPAINRSGDMTSITISLDSRRGARGFLRYCNDVAWPLFHFRLDRIEYKPAHFRGYCRANAWLAEMLEPVLRREDVIWIHGCELIPLARFLRSRGCRHRIGFFLHVPFPPPELMAASPNHRALVEALLHCDVVGFQTRNDMANFRRYVKKFTYATPTGETIIRTGERSVTVCSLPVGIDVDATLRSACEAGSDIEIESLLHRVLGRRQIVSVDNVDDAAGLAQRFQAYARFLADHPELHRTVTFLQIARPPDPNGGNADELLAELDRLSGMISGDFGTLDWIPIRYMNRQVSEARIAAILRASRVGLVAPLREGMSLLAKDYVAAQDATDPGVLMLSRFSGAAEELKEAVLVNPYDVEDTAERLLEAVTMPLEERRQRHEALHARISRHDVNHWYSRFLEILRGRAKDSLPRRGDQAPQAGERVEQMSDGARETWNEGRSGGLG